MVALEQVAEIASSLPETTEGERHNHRTWFVAGKAFAWHRPFSKADIKRYGNVEPPQGDIVAVSVADLHEKEAVLAAGHEGVFTIPHFDGYAAVLIELRRVRKPVIRELLTDAWLASAPPAVVDGFVSSRRRTR
ncbi:MAG: MmcQ/YjbR family DNA-binding protein [Frankiaceae bacterium]|nr:MmcQ/YjbR family DNA-binding protein [Frankiaceae bacterium]